MQSRHEPWLGIVPFGPQDNAPPNGATPDRAYVTFMTAYCHNCSILLSVIVSNLLLCLNYDLIFSISMYV